MENKNVRTIFWVSIFAIAFGFVEAAVVIYLRHLLGVFQPRIDPSQILFLVPGITFLEPRTAVQIITNTALLNVEMIREAGTLVMLVSVSVIAGRTIREKLAYFFLAFGIWDIFYYIFLRLIIGWPKTFSDLDIFFLLPFPWVGPVFVPIAISTLLVFCSLLLTLRKKIIREIPAGNK